MHSNIIQSNVYIYIDIHILSNNVNTISFSFEYEQILPCLIENYDNNGCARILRFGLEGNNHSGPKIIQVISSNFRSSIFFAWITKIDLEICDLLHDSFYGFWPY